MAGFGDDLFDVFNEAGNHATDGKPTKSIRYGHYITSYSFMLDSGLLVIGLVELYHFIVIKKVSYVTMRCEKIKLY